MPNLILSIDLLQDAFEANVLTHGRPCGLLFHSGLLCATQHALARLLDLKDLLVELALFEAKGLGGGGVQLQLVVVAEGVAQVGLLRSLIDAAHLVVFHLRLAPASFRDRVRLISPFQLAALLASPAGQLPAVGQGRRYGLFSRSLRLWLQERVSQRLASRAREAHARQVLRQQ